MITSESNRSLYTGRVAYAALLLFLSVPLAAQTGESGSTGTSELKIKTETRLVLVDAVVTAKKDEPVGSLTAKDFHVFEDGKEQPITAFQTHAGTAIAEMTQQQHIVLLFDGRSNDDPIWIEQAAEKFVADNAGPNRMMSVAYYDGGCMTIAAQFTADVGQLRHALSDWSKTRRCPPAPDPQGYYRAEKYSQLARSLAQVPGHKVVALFTARTARQSATADIAQGPTQERAGGGVNNGLGAPGATTGLGASPLGARPGNQGSNAATNDAALVALFDPKGMLLEFRKADVSVYAVEGQSGARSPAWAITLAEKTGGHELNRGNDVIGAFALLAREQDQAYTLGYAPPDSPDGSCHTLKVTVDQPKVKVRGRDLYCNVPEAALAINKSRDTALESLAAAPHAGNTAASAALPFFYEDGGAARVNLVLEIPAPVLDVTEVSGKQRASMDVLGLAYNSDGKVVARFSDTARYSFDNRQQFDEFLRHPLHYEHQFRIAAGDYKYKLIFRTGKDRFGVVEAPLAVDPFQSGKLGMSDIALSHDVQPITQDTAQMDLRMGEKPLIFNHKRITVAGSDLLPRTGIGEAYFEVYMPAPKGAEPVSLTMRLRLFNVPGNQQVDDSGDIDLSALAVAGGRTIPVGLKLPVATIAAGSYRAEITVKDTAGGEAVRSVQFRVE
ncbi:MAG: VWA domain-containing protein [Bryobacteraceae bacterium]